MTISEPPTGLSPHYEADRGASYSAWQLRTTLRTAKITARTYASFVSAEKSVLDFGCGGGSVIATLPCKERFGVEPNPASRRVALDRGIACEDNLDKFADASMDVVMSNHALEHCLNPHGELVQMARVLRETGTFVLVVPSETFKAEPHDDPKDHNHHLYTWTPRSIGHLVREAGFVVDSVTLRRSAWPPGVGVLASLPKPIFGFLCAIWSRIVHVQEILVVAHRP